MSREGRGAVVKNPHQDTSIQSPAGAEVKNEAVRWELEGSANGIVRDQASKSLIARPGHTTSGRPCASCNVNSSGTPSRW